MPTYQRRSTYSGVLTEFGISVASNEAVATEIVMTETVLTFASAPAYTIGELVTEAGSSVTGYVYWQDGTRVGIINASGEFTGDATITGADSSEAHTPSDVENRLERTADTPVYTPLLHTHEVSSTGTSDPQTLHLDATTQWIEVKDGTVGLSLANHASSYLVATVGAGERLLVRRQYKIGSLLVLFSASGTCTVNEYETLEPPFLGNN